MPHLDDAYTLACYLLRDEHAAQDVVQDASLRALRYLASYRGGDARAWFLAIVRNCCHGWRRRERGERAPVPLSPHVVDALPDERTADAAAVAESERVWIRRAVDALPPEFREAVVLREVHELSYAEMSRVMHVPIGTVMSRLSRARRRLASLLGSMSREVG